MSKNAPISQGLDLSSFLRLLKGALFCFVFWARKK